MKEIGSSTQVESTHLRSNKSTYTSKGHAILNATTTPANLPSTFGQGVGSVTGLTEVNWK